MERLNRLWSLTRARRQAGGFLLELGVVLLVVGVLTVATFEVQSALRKRQQNTDAKSLLLTIDANLRAFVIREHRLPCPAVGISDVEARSAMSCTAGVGGVPFITLGMDVPRKQDVVYRYGLAEQLTVGGPGFLNRAEAAAQTPPSIAQPYVARRDDEQFLGRCGAALLNPAYALMWMPLPGPEAPTVPPLCFRESSDRSMGLLAVSGQEFLGWLQANLRQ